MKKAHGTNRIMGEQNSDGYFTIHDDMRQTIQLILSRKGGSCTL
jgi:hypothetical protein